MSPAPASFQPSAVPLARRLLHGALHALAALLVMGCAVTTAPAQTGYEAAEVPPPGRVGKVGLLSGDVTLTDLRTREQQPASLNWPITSGYRLSAGPLARAEVRIGSLAVRLDGDTDVDFARVDDEVIQIVVQRGSVALRARSREILPEIDLVTPRERIVFDDVGRYRVDVDRAAGITALTAFVGSARIATTRGTFTVRSGQRGEYGNAPGAGFTLVQPAYDTFDDWVASRDRRDDQIASRQYVSPETTGVEVLDTYGAWRTVPEYGAVWYPAAVPAGWAPYRYGRWAYISPWGWTWIDDAPWGFAPFHYGRWALIGGVWGWVPGAYVARPYYAPALVAWYGAPGVSVGVGFGSVGWFPLAPYEPYIPPYYYNRRYITGVNIGNVRDIDYGRIAPPPTYVHQRPGAATWVPNDAILRSEPIKRVVQTTPPAEASQFVGRPTPPPVLTDVGKRRAVDGRPNAPAIPPKAAPGADAPVRAAPRPGAIDTPLPGAPAVQPGRSKFDAPDRAPQVAPVPAAPPVTKPVAPATPSAPAAPARPPEMVTKPQPMPPAPSMQPRPAPQGDADAAPVRRPMVVPRPEIVRPAPSRIEPSPRVEQAVPPPRANPHAANPPPMRGPQADIQMRAPQPKVPAEAPRVEPPRGDAPRGGPKFQRDQ